MADLKGNGWHLSQLQPAWAVLAGVLYLISQLPSGWFWRGILAALGQTVGLARALRAYYIGHLGKYVPGKAMVVVLRAALVGQPHVKTSMAVVAVFYETFTTMAVGAVLAALILVCTHREHAWLIAGSLALACVVGVPTFPPVFVRLLRLMRMTPATSVAVGAPDESVEIKVADSLPATAAAFSHWRLLARGWLTIAVGWIFAGASLWATLRAIGVENSELLADLSLCTATVALAVVLGFVSMLPAGVGVRDLALMQLLAPRLEQLAPDRGQLLAMIAVVVLRLIWLAAEGVLAVAIYPFGRHVNKAA
jgi:hypothetical protein